MEDRRRLLLLAFHSAYHVYRLALGGERIEPAGAAQRLGQGQVGGLEGHRLRPHHLADHIHLFAVVVRQEQVIAGLEVDVLGHRAAAVEFVEVEPVLAAVAGQHEAGEVGADRIDRGRADGLGQGQGRGGDRLALGLDEGALQGHALAAVIDDADVDLRALHVMGDARGDLRAQFLDGQALGADHADIGIEQGAVGPHQAAVGRGLLLGAGRRGQFGMVPDGDVQGVAAADAVSLGLVRQQLDRHRGFHPLLRGQERRRDRHHLDVAVLGQAAAGELPGRNELARRERAAAESDDGGQGRDARNLDHAERFSKAETRWERAAAARIRRGTVRCALTGHAMRQRGGGRAGTRNRRRPHAAARMRGGVRGRCVDAKWRHGAVSVAVSNGQAPVPRSIASPCASLSRAHRGIASRFADGATAIQLRFRQSRRGEAATNTMQCRNDANIGERERMFNVRVELMRKAHSA